MNYLEFQGIKKWYHNKLILVDNNKVLNEQWFRFQIIKICKVLSIKITDELDIQYPNVILCEKIKQANTIDLEFTKEEKESLSNFGLLQKKMIIPIPTQQLTYKEFIKIENDIINTNKNIHIKWKQWEKHSFQEKNIIQEDEISFNDFTTQLFETDEEDYLIENNLYTENYTDESVTNLITTQFENSDQMKKIGDCLFDSIVTILNEKTNKQNTANDLRQMIIEYVSQLSDDNLKLYIGSITDENYQNTNTTKITNYNNRSNLNQILKKMIMNTNYWGDSAEVTYFYNYLRETHNIILLVIDENTYKLKFNPHTFRNDSLYSIIAYTGNHYYNKKYTKLNKYIFKNNQIDFNELERLISNPIEYKKGKRIFETKNDFKLKLIERLENKTIFTKEQITQVFKIVQNIFKKNNIISNESEFLSYLYNNEIFNRLLLKTNEYLNKQNKTTEQFMKQLKNINLTNYLLTNKMDELTAFLENI